MPGPYGNYASSYSAAPPENMSYYNFYYTPENQYQYFPPYSTYGTPREQDYLQYTWDQSTVNLGPAPTPAPEQTGAFRDQGAGYGDYGNGYGYEGGGGFWGPQQYGSNMEYYRLGGVKRLSAI